VRRRLSRRRGPQRLDLPRLDLEREQLVRGGEPVLQKFILVWPGSLKALLNLHSKCLFSFNLNGYSISYMYFLNTPSF
jgi:hypothetical protein